MQFWQPLIPSAVVQSGGGVNVTPATGHLVLTGYVPTVNQTTTTLYSPTAGHLILTGYAPTVAHTGQVFPTTGHLVLTGHVPTVTQALYVTPATGHLVLTGYAPQVAQTFFVTPATGHLILTGYAPTVNRSGVLVPATGHLVFTGYVPTVDQTTTVAFTRGGYKKAKPKVWKNEREAIRKALRRAIDGPEQEEFERVLAPYIKPQAPGSIFDKIDWNQVGIEAVAIEARLNAIVQEYEDEELMLLL